MNNPKVDQMKEPPPLQNNNYSYMNKIIPFKNLQEAETALDNGGRFYNLFTHAQDGQISSQELSKVAGLFSDQQKSILFLELSLLRLEASAKEQLLKSFSDELKQAYDKHCPQHLSPSEASIKGNLSSTAIIRGIPQKVEARTEFNGFIMIPIVAGNVTTFSMIPIFDEYDVYHIHDQAQGGSFFVAHYRGAGQLPEKCIIAGGILKELEIKENGEKKPRKFLETLYYTEAK